MGIRQSEINKSQGNNQTRHTKLKTSDKTFSSIIVGKRLKISILYGRKNDSDIKIHDLSQLYFNIEFKTI